MHRRRLFCLLSIICALMLVSVAVAQLPAYKEIELGKQALAHGKYDEAIQHFENANNQVQMNVMVQLDLANAFAGKYVPGADNADNARVADQAINYYQRVLDGNTSRIASFNAAKGVALLKAQMNQFDEAKDYFARAEKLDQRDPDSYYWTAVIDWTVSNQFRLQQRTKLKLKPEDSLPEKNHEICILVRGNNWSNLDDGIDNLNKTLELDPKSEGAMTYMNLVYLERADVECDDPGIRKSDLKTAGEWAQKLAALKKLKATHPQKKKTDDDDDD
ncbi:MAG: hypothetical protein WA213_17535 [Terriglobales bacterium]